MVSAIICYWPVLITHTCTFCFTMTLCTATICTVTLCTAKFGMVKVFVQFNIYSKILP